MVRTIAVTGHMDLVEGTEPLPREALRGLLHEPSADTCGLVGVSCAASGADSVFCEELLDCGGELSIVLPFHGYRQSLDGQERRARFDRLEAAASQVTVLPYPQESLAAFEAANSELLRQADVLIAMWDRAASKKGGGTAAAVAAARAAGIPVHVVWPPGAHRG
jgi:hypothetical protein